MRSPRRLRARQTQGLLRRHTRVAPSRARGTRSAARASTQSKRGTPLRSRCVWHVRQAFSKGLYLQSLQSRTYAQRTLSVKQGSGRQVPVRLAPTRSVRSAVTVDSGRQLQRIRLKKRQRMRRAPGRTRPVRKERGPWLPGHLLATRSALLVGAVFSAPRRPRVRRLRVRPCAHLTRSASPGNSLR